MLRGTLRLRYVCLLSVVVLGLKNELACDRWTATKPDTLRATEGGVAIFWWDLQALNTGYYKVTIQHGQVDVLAVDTRFNWVTSYSPRLQGTFNTTGVGFNLSAATISDTENNFTVTLVTPQGICSSVSLMSIYKRPTIPRIEIHPSTEPAQGDDVTISCVSDSTSVPVLQQLPITYTWILSGMHPHQSRGIPHEKMIGSGGNLVLRDIQKDAGGEITCQATEERSPLNSRSTIFLRIQDRVLSHHVLLSSVLGAVLVVAITGAVVFLRCRGIHRGVQSTNNIDDIYLQTAPAISGDFNTTRGQEGRDPIDNDITRTAVTSGVYYDIAEEAMAAL